MFYLLNKSRLPKSKHRLLKLIPEKCDVEAFHQLNNLKTNILEFVKSGDSLCICSKNCGNGKTTWAIKLMQAFFNGVWFGNRYRTRAVFINVPNFMTKLRENISNKDEELEQLLTDLETADLVIWDDIAACTIKEFDHLNLYSYIDGRILNEKSNIFTSNLIGEAFKTAIGERLYSRVWNKSIKVEFKGLDRRGE